MAANLADLVARLEATLGPNTVRTGGKVPVRNGSDASRLPVCMPSVLVTPTTTQGVSQVLGCCSEAGWPVVVQGGLTGLAGGGHPKPGEVALSLERMTGIEEVDVVAGTLTARAGTTLQRIQEAAAGAGFLCGIDLGARGSCTIGGNVATNAGGNQVLRYGMTRQNVLGLEAVLADGTIVSSMNKMLKNNTGYDWTQLFIGAEGTLGVVTRVILALHPQPRSVATAFCTVPDFAGAVAVQRKLERDLSGRLLAFEAMWHEVMDLAQTRLDLRTLFSLPYGIALLIEVEADDDALEAGLENLYEQGMIVEALVARSEADRRKFWSYRETPYEYRGQFGTMVSFDVSLPRGTMAIAIDEITDAITTIWQDAITTVFGHLADSNVHIIILRETATPNAKVVAEPVVYGIVGRHCGSISAEHGIGEKKREFLHLSRAPSELSIMKTIKAALDPNDIMNRGRIF